MAKAHLILPRPDSRCGKVFYDDRRAAEGHRIALDFWNRATGRVRQGYQLAVYRCKRCGGFHISQLPIERLRRRSISDGLGRVANRDQFEESRPDAERLSEPGPRRLEDCQM
jgi:hypothetical protein